MSRPFALWITDAGEIPSGLPQHWVRGCTLGRAPEPGDALTLIGPLTPPLRTRCRGLLGTPRGGAGADGGIVISPIAGIEASCLVGGILVEEGVAARAFGARLLARRTRMLSPARFVLRGEDRAWGIVSVNQERLNGIIVGGGVGDREFWDVLIRIEPQDGAAFDGATSGDVVRAS